MVPFYQQGRGYSLAADIQYVDARLEIPVVLPLRDCTSQELNMLCKLERSDDMLPPSFVSMKSFMSSFSLGGPSLVREEFFWQAFTR